MANLATLCYGLGDSRKDAKDVAEAGVRNSRSHPGGNESAYKGGKVTRFVAKAANNIAYAEIFVNADTTMAANETITFTVTAG